MVRALQREVEITARALHWSSFRFGPTPRASSGRGKQEDVLKVLILCDDGLSIDDSIVPDRLIRCEEYSYFFDVNGSMTEELGSGMSIDFLEKKSVACSLSAHSRCPTRCIHQLRLLYTPRFGTVPVRGGCHGENEYHVG